MSKKVQKPGRYVQYCPKTKRPKSRYLTTRHIQFTFRLIFMKYRFAGDTSERSFRSLCKMAFFGTKNGPYLELFGPFELVASRIDGSNCPLQNWVFKVSNHFFDPKSPKMTGLRPEKGSKTPQSGSKMMPK